MYRKVISVLSLVSAVFLFVGSTPAQADKKSNQNGRFGISQLVNGQYKDAEKSLRAAVKADPKNRLWWLNLAWTTNALKKSDDAIAAFKKAAALTQPNEYYVMGWILWGLAQAYEDKKDCVSMTRQLAQWIAVTKAQSDDVKNRNIVKKQIAVAREKIRLCPKRSKADER